MIVLSFSMDHSDIEETEQFMKKDFAPELCEILEDWIPNGNITFLVDKLDAEPCGWKGMNGPLLEFAIKLNRIVHTIKVGDVLVLDTTLQSNPVQFSMTAENILILRFGAANTCETICELAEMQASSEAFCTSLYDFILKQFPGYFEMMDRRACGAPSPEESASARKIRFLSMRTVQG